MVTSVLTHFEQALESHDFVEVELQSTGGRFETSATKPLSAGYWDLTHRFNPFDEGDSPLS